MTRREHLLTIASEECAEIAQRCSKAIRFGESQLEPGQAADNVWRVIEEYNDLIAVMQMLRLDKRYDALIATKRAKVEDFLRFSEACGTLDPAAALAPENHLRHPLDAALAELGQQPENGLQLFDKFPQTMALVEAVRESVRDVEDGHCESCGASLLTGCYITRDDVHLCRTCYYEVPVSPRQPAAALAQKPEKEKTTDDES